MDVTTNPAVRQLVELALSEDIGPGDITTDSLIPEEQQGEGIVVAFGHGSRRRGQREP